MMNHYGKAWFSEPPKVGGTGYDDPEAVEVGSGGGSGGGSAGGGLPGVVVNFTISEQACTSDISLPEAMAMFRDGQPIWIKSNDPRMPVVQMTYCAESGDSKFEGLYGIVPTHTLDGALVFKDVSWTYSYGNEIFVCIISTLTNEGIVEGDNFGGVVTRP